MNRNWRKHRKAGKNPNTAGNITHVRRELARTQGQEATPQNPKEHCRLGVTRNRCVQCDDCIE